MVPLLPVQSVCFGMANSPALDNLGCVWPKASGSAAMTRIVFVIVGMPGHLDSRATAAKHHEEDIVNVLTTTKGQPRRDLVLLSHVGASPRSHVDDHNDVESKYKNPSKDRNPEEGQSKDQTQQDAIVAEGGLLARPCTSIPRQTQSVNDLGHEDGSTKQAHPEG